MSRPVASEKVSKVVFIFAVAFLAFTVGLGIRDSEWYPGSFLEEASNAVRVAARATLKTSHFQSMAPRVYDRVGARPVTPGAMGDGLTMVSSLWEEFGWQPGLKLLDSEGRAVHAWHVAPNRLFPAQPGHRTGREPDRTNSHGFHLFPNGDVLVVLSYVGVARLDACSRVLWRLPAGIHHVISEADDGSFWMAGGRWMDSDAPADGSDALPGLPERVYRDRILRVDSDAGRVLTEIDVLEILYTNGLERYIPKGSAYSPDERPSDVTHLNDVEPLPSSMAAEYPLFDAGDLLLSVHHLDLVLVLDPESRKVLWHANEPFIQQHDPDWLGAGWIGVFDNNRDGTFRGHMLGGSRIVALQPHTGSTRVLFPTVESDRFYTGTQGDWQQLDNGHYLLTESRAGRIVEVAPDGRTVWEWIAKPYDDDRVPEVSAAARYDLAPEQVQSWPCSS